jgi:hypothetical protein
MTSKQPQVGDQYRTVGSAFRNTVWDLNEIFTSRDGIEHARLSSAYNATECKTLAVSVIADTNRFILAKTSARNAAEGTRFRVPELMSEK